MTLCLDLFRQNVEACHFQNFVVALNRTHKMEQKNENSEIRIPQPPSPPPLPPPPPSTHHKFHRKTRMLESPF